MTLTAGATLGPYEILARVGAGGMGEVYKAHDTRLNRTVAIKVLPAALTADPDARLRLNREAKAVAALSHPHICSLFDIGHQDGTDFLVMEFLEGETLAERLTRGKLPIDEALRTGIQIADGLATAHKAAIIHRDLKPGNIMLTKRGATLLDFGLAKPPPVALSAGMTQVATEQALTGVGTLVGTLQYMAPEQLQGLSADAAHRRLRVRVRAVRDGHGETRVCRGEPGEPDLGNPLVRTTANRRNAASEPAKP